jgi:hypothetical protein
MRRPGERPFWAAAATGILCSVPFVYGDAGFRGLAASYPFFALFLALGFSPRRGSFHPERKEGLLIHAAAATTGGIVLLALLVPGIAHHLWPRPSADSRAGLRPGTTMLVDMARSPAVLVSRSPRANLADVPWIDERAYAELLELAALPEDVGLSTLRLPFSLATVYDHVTRRAYLLAGPVDLLRQRGFVPIDVVAIGSTAVAVRDTRLTAGAAPVSGPGPRQ